MAPVLLQMELADQIQADAFTQPSTELALLQSVYAPMLSPVEVMKAVIASTPIAMVPALQQQTRLHTQQQIVLG
jgi:hypothetical protein